MPYTYPLPGRAELINDIAALEAQQGRNADQIAILADQNEQTGQQLIYAADTLSAMNAQVYLAPPANFTATSPAPGRAELSYDLNVNATEYALEQALQPDYSDSQEIWRGPNNSPDDIDGLQSGITYYFRLKAVNPIKDDSDWATANVMIM